MKKGALHIAQYFENQNFPALHFTCFPSGRVLFKLPLRMFKFLTLGVHYLEVGRPP